MNGIFFGVVGGAFLLGFVVAGRGIWCGKDGQQDGGTWSGDSSKFGGAGTNDTGFTPMGPIQNRKSPGPGDVRRASPLPRRSAPLSAGMTGSGGRGNCKGDSRCKCTPRGGVILRHEGLAACGGEEDGVEVEAVGCGLGDAEVAAVRWVECAAERGYAHEVYCLAFGRRVGIRRITDIFEFSMVCVR
jgi:hypothetical protein